MKNFLKKQWPSVIIILVFFLISFIYYTSAYSQKLTRRPLTIAAKHLAIVKTSPTQVKTNFPLRLKIPSINVNAAIEYVGLTSSGNMNVPKNIYDVAWYKLGSVPGATGSAVIDGHLDGQYGQKAVFYNLNKLKPGDELFIVDNQGKIITFIVRALRAYNSAASAPEVFSSASGQHLNLITCAGYWDGSKASYTKRLVVFSDLK